MGVEYPEVAICGCYADYVPNYYTDAKSRWAGAVARTGLSLCPGVLRQLLFRNRRFSVASVFLVQWPLCPAFATALNRGSFQISSFQSFLHLFWR